MPEQILAKRDWVNYLYAAIVISLSTAAFGYVVYWGLLQIPEDNAINNGSTVEGTVISRNVDERSSGGTDYIIRYQFDIPAGSFTGQQEVSKGFYEDHQNQEITVHYASDNPDLSRVQRTDDGIKALIGGIIGIIGVPVALFLMVRARQWNLQQQRRA